MDAVPQVIEPLYYVCKIEPISNTSTYTVYEIPLKYADRLRKLDEYVEKMLKKEFPKDPRGMPEKVKYANRKQELRDYVREKKRKILVDVGKLAAEEIAKKSSDQLRYFDADTGVLSRGDVKTLPGLREKRVTELLTKKPINITRLF